MKEGVNVKELPNNQKYNEGGNLDKKPVVRQDENNTQNSNVIKYNSCLNLYVKTRII